MRQVTKLLLPFTNGNKTTKKPLPSDAVIMGVRFNRKEMQPEITLMTDSLTTEEKEHIFTYAEDPAQGAGKFLGEFEPVENRGETHYLFMVA